MAVARLANFVEALILALAQRRSMSAMGDLPSIRNNRRRRSHDDGGAVASNIEVQVRHD